MNLKYRILLTFFAFFVTGIACYSQLPDSVITSSSADTSKALVTIGDVTITGYKKTKSYIIQREIPFVKGDYMSRSELRNKLVLCKQQLMNTSLFVDVDVSEHQVADVVFVNIAIKERWYLFPLPYFKIVDRNFNEWWVQNKRSLQRVNFGLKFMQNNVSGRNDKLNIWIFGGYTKQVSLRYENPFIDKNLKHGLNIGFAYSNNHEVNYVTDSNKQRFLKDPNQFLTRTTSVDVGYSYRPGIKTRHNFRVAYSDLQLEDTVIMRNPKFFPVGQNRARFADISYTVQHYDVDYIPYPLKGFQGEATLHKRLGAGTNLWLMKASGSYSFKMAPKTYMQFQAVGSLILPFRQSYFASRMFGGSDYYMRGLEYYVTERVAGGIFRATAKKEVLSFNVHNPIGGKTHNQIPFRIFVKGYGDVGYSHLPHSERFYIDAGLVRKPVYSFLNNKLLRTGGIGIDIITFYDVVLKFEYSFNQFGSSGLFFHTRSDF